MEISSTIWMGVSQIHLEVAMYIHSRECGLCLESKKLPGISRQNIVPKMPSLMGWLVMLIRYQCANCTLAARALGCTC